MIKFNEIKYNRLDYNDIKNIINNLTIQLRKCKNKEDFLDVFKKITTLHSEIEQMTDYADVCNMRNILDEFWLKEIEFWNEYKSKFDLLFNEAYGICNTSSFKNEINEVIPENFFNSFIYSNKVTSDEVLDLIKQDNNFKILYRKIFSKKCLFRGNEVSINEITKLFSSNDRDERKEAHDVYNNFFINNKDEIDSLFLKIVKIRKEIASKLGFSDFAEMSIYSLRRFGYNYNDIKKFRNNIIKYILPLANKIKEYQKIELNIDEVKYYDTVFYKEEPKLLFYNEDLLIKMKEVFTSIDNEAGIFYSDLLENNYIDLLNRNGKINYGITNYLTLSEIPTITGKFKGKYYDLIMMTHEFGHAFQKYIASIEDKKHIVSPMLKYPTFDIAEMFSYAMELICLDNEKEIFNEEDYKKFTFLKIKDLITTMPYIAATDEFQELLYKGDANIKTIRKLWIKICKKYNLTTYISGHQNLENGGYFFRQSHIWINPFYYIDYAISYFGAFAIWKNCNNDLNYFKNIASVASYYPLHTLIKKFKLSNPFSEIEMKELSIFLEKQLNKYK